MHYHKSRVVLPSGYKVHFPRKTLQTRYHITLFLYFSEFKASTPYLASTDRRSKLRFVSEDERTDFLHQGTDRNG